MSILLNLDSTLSSGNTQTDNFRVVFNQPLNLEGEGGYEIALLQAKLWYSWYNISAENGNNLMRYSTDAGLTWKNVTFPDGQYEISQINDYLHRIMKNNGDYFVNGSGQDDWNIDILANFSTLKVQVDIVSGSNYQLDLASSKIYTLLGFAQIVVTTSQSGTNIANINNDINSLSIETDVVSGTYNNGLAGNVLWTFVPTTAPGTNIDINIINPVYIPVSANRIQSISMRIIDNLGRRVNLNSQPVTYLLALRKTRDNSITNDLLRKLVEK